MTTLFFSLMGLSVVSTWILFQRQEAVAEEVARMLPEPEGEATGGEEPFLGALRRLLQRAAERDLGSPDRGARPLGRRRIPHREGQDPYTDVEVLVRHLRSLPLPTDFVGLERRIKGLYQLGAALELEDRDLDEALGLLVARLRRVRFMDAGVSRVEIVPRGAPYDRATMWPLTPGDRVVRPLGVVAFGRDGQVLSRAKVLCEADPASAT